MQSITTTTILLSLLRPIHTSIHLFHTQDGSPIEFYDCVFVYDLPYCRRPTAPVDLTRSHHPLSCDGRPTGIRRHFSQMRSANISISTVLHRWKSSLEQVEAYARYSHHPTQFDGVICQCEGESVFGKDCEYELPYGSTLEQTLDWQMEMRNADEWKVQIYGNITCYDGISCNSGVLCLDWREICDGIQNCMYGHDEENCDILEMNMCDEDEYRCSNGLCIPDAYFLDGELDCLDWTDEMRSWQGSH